MGLGAGPSSGLGFERGALTLTLTLTVTITSAGLGFERGPYRRWRRALALGNRVVPALGSGPRLGGAQGVSLVRGRPTRGP